MLDGLSEGNTRVVCQSNAFSDMMQLANPHQKQHKTLHIEECPIFYPSYQEFHEKSFTELIAECEAKSGDAAIFKVSDSLLTLPR